MRRLMYELASSMSLWSAPLIQAITAAGVARGVSRWIAIFTALALTGMLTACAAVSPGSDGTDSPTARASAIHLALAQAYFRRGQMQIALGEVNQALSDNPDSAAELGTRALIEQSLGQVSAATQDYRSALSLDPHAVAIRTDFGWLLCSDHAYHEAMAQFTLARSGLEDASNPGMARLDLDSGVCAYRAGMWQVALRDLNQALAVEPAAPVVQTNLALVLFRSGHARDALAQLQTVNSNPGADAQTLWLGVLVARRLGDTLDMQEWRTRLVREFPNSEWAILAQQADYDDKSIFGY
jgi:type IV pilus assembly protein PilF